MMNRIAQTHNYMAAYREAVKYWHLACNYDRLNPKGFGQSFTENNPHLGNYRKALQRMKAVTSW